MYGHHPGQQQQQNDRPFKCDRCPQYFNRNHDLKRHKRIHLTVRLSQPHATQREIIVKPEPPEPNGLDVLPEGQPDLCLDLAESPLPEVDAERKIKATKAAILMSPYFRSQFPDEGDPLVSGLEGYSHSPAYSPSSPANSPTNRFFSKPIFQDEPIQEPGGNGSEHDEQTKVYEAMSRNSFGAFRGSDGAKKYRKVCS
jgi:hypothetical protein